MTDTEHLRSIGRAYEPVSHSLSRAIVGAADTIDLQAAQLAAYPADWRTDSSLETWFPLTAEQLKAQAAEINRLRDALDAAQRSLNTIATLGGSEADFMGTMRQVRGYANNRARVARAALAQEAHDAD